MPPDPLARLSPRHLSSLTGLEPPPPPSAYPGYRPAVMWLNSRRGRGSQNTLYPLCPCDVLMARRLLLFLIITRCSAAYTNRVSLTVEIN